ncbi:hypothetical protein HELRODRAFT_162794 [Helobdella robusta]|uniref:Uncharacterized protein n=1 Tax=Helobdella robusta TaxID=6412 RepID=T1ET59_HELRO|nr:hypothetical protein HELRODRAFT_162794 [Helobdella robusta]ESN99276.1 hypothetical protein HELRODRAFT_162794 [Helobdella robusta]
MTTDPINNGENILNPPNIIRLDQPGECIADYEQDARRNLCCCITALHIQLACIWRCSNRFRRWLTTASPQKQVSEARSHVIRITFIKMFLKNQVILVHLRNRNDLQMPNAFLKIFAPFSILCKHFLVVSGVLVG